MTQPQDRDRHVIEQALKNYQRLVATGRIPKPATVPPRDSGQSRERGHTRMR